MKFKNLKEIFKYLTNGYRYELEDVKSKNGIQKRLKNEEIGETINNQIKEILKYENI